MYRKNASHVQKQLDIQYMKNKDQEEGLMALCWRELTACGIQNVTPSHFLYFPLDINVTTRG